MNSDKPFNPLDKMKLGEMIRDELVAQPVSLFPPARFQGAGIYALYFSGENAQGYEALRSVNTDKAGWKLPVYVGKAIPQGGRKGVSLADASEGTAIWQRVSQHSKTLQEAGFDLSHFRFRYLVVEDIWIPLGETLTVMTFRPVWNLALDGFGNKTPGKNRSQLPSWDIAHPGREWSRKAVQDLVSKGEYSPVELEARRTQLLEKVALHLQSTTAKIGGGTLPGNPEDTV